MSEKDLHKFYEAEKDNPETLLKTDYFHELDSVISMVVNRKPGTIKKFLERCKEKEFQMNPEKVEAQKETLKILDEIVDEINAILETMREKGEAIEEKKNDLFEKVKKAYEAIYGNEGLSKFSHFLGTYEMKKQLEEMKKNMSTSE